MLRLAALCLALTAPIAQAAPSLTCHGQEQGIGDTANQGPVVLKITPSAKVILKWETSSRYLMNESVVCGDVLPEQPNCVAFSEAREGGMVYLQSCGDPVYRRGLPVYSSTAKLELNSEGSAGRFTCASRTGASILIELSGCR